MAISKVRVQINGTWTNLTYNSSTGAYEATISAPSTTSYNKTGGYYPVTVEATNDVGTVATANDTHGMIGPYCRLVVKERVAPVVTIISPSSGARVINNKQPVVFTVTDESGGSGVDLGSLVVQLDDREQTAQTLEFATITNGYRCTFIPGTALAEGDHRFSAQIGDYDGNVSKLVDIVFTVDTVAPTLDVTYPPENFRTSSTSITVTGTTNDITSSPVTLHMKMDDDPLEVVTVASNGAFTKTFSGLSPGWHDLNVFAEDAAGQVTGIVRRIFVDTSVPKFTKITITPNPVDAGSTMKISVVVS